MRGFAGLVLLLFAVSACEENSPEPSGGTFSDGVFVVCEGGFGSSNARVDFVGRDASQQTAVFSAANAGLPLGDVAQSMSDDAMAYWLVVNNSATVHRLNREDLRSEATIDVQASPRYVQSTADGQAVLVTDLFAGRVAVCDREGNFLRSLSANGGWTERMLKAEDNRIWVADMTNNRLRIADPMAMGWVDSVATGTEPEGLVQDADGRIWALCTGGFVDPEPRLQAFEANGTAFFDEALDTAASYPTSLSLSPDGRTLYWLSSQGVHRMAIDAATPPTGAWIPSAGANWYALGCDPKSGILYVADAVDFASAGQVSRYTAEGTLLDAFETGINPGHFFFTE